MVNHVTRRFVAACIATIAVTHVGYRGQAIGLAGGPSSGTSQAATKPVAAHAGPVWHYEGSYRSGALGEPQPEVQGVRRRAEPSRRSTLRRPPVARRRR